MKLNSFFSKIILLVMTLFLMAVSVGCGNKTGDSASVTTADLQDVAKDDNQEDKEEELSDEELYAYGATYYGNEQFDKGLDYFNQSASAGNGDAMFMLGVANFYGTGTAKDQKEGVEWFEKALDKGVDMADIILAIAYFNGYGVTEDDDMGDKHMAAAGKSTNEDVKEIVKIRTDSLNSAWPTSQWINTAEYKIKSYYSDAFDESLLNSTGGNSNNSGTNIAPNLDNGSSERDCPACTGGKQICVTCNGSGQVKRLQDSPYYGGGSGGSHYEYETCPSCNGSGYERCIQCGGTGTLG